MKHRNQLSLFLILLFLSILKASGQQPQEFALPVARVGQDYRVEIETVLRNKYQLKLKSGNTNAVILWTNGSGELPAGLSLRTDGTIIGRTNEVRTGTYQFSLKAVEISAAL